MEREEFAKKLLESEQLAVLEWDHVGPRDVVVAFMCLWRVARDQPSMMIVWEQVKVRLPLLTAKIEEAWPRGESSTLES